MTRLLFALLSLAAPALAGDGVRVVESRPPVETQGARATHHLRLSVYMFRGGRWSPDDIAAAVRGAERILEQCGVALSGTQLHTVQAPSRFRVYSTPVARELLRRMSVRKPAVFFVDDTRNDPPFDAEAIGRANAASRPELADTVWVAHGTRDLAQALAHELVHVLADSGAHSDAPRNLMREETSPGDTQLTPAQCGQMRAQGTAHGLLAGVGNEGTVVSVDRARKEIVIRHGRLSGFDMPPMTMAFEVRDARLLDQAVAGERVRFDLEIVDGRFTVTQIRRARR